MLLWCFFLLHFFIVLLCFFFLSFFFDVSIISVFFFFVANSMEAVQSEDGTQANTHTHMSGEEPHKVFFFFKAGC